jgi:hypothetical protein
MLRPWVMAGALSACLAAGQPTFDVAAIHKSSPDAKWAYRLGPGGGAVLTGFRVRDLILLAWRTQDFRLLAEPGWAGADRFDIEARAEGSPGEDEFRLMLRSLLEDRFQLILRSESRSMRTGNAADWRSRSREVALRLTIPWDRTSRQIQMQRHPAVSPRTWFGMAPVPSSSCVHAPSL